MGNNIEHQIKYSINDSYNQQQQELFLVRSGHIWVDVLQSRDWSALKSLILYKSLVNDDNFQVLTSKYWPQLTKLSLNYNKITCKSIQNMVFKMQNQPNQSLYNLQSLNLSYNNIGLVGIQWLIKLHLPKLQILQLGSCYFGSQGFKTMTKSAWSNLNTLNLVYYSEQNESIIFLDGWQIMYLFNWKRFSKLLLYQKQAICLTNCVLMISSSFSTDLTQIYIENQGLDKTIKEMIENKYSGANN